MPEVVEPTPVPVVEEERPAPDVDPMPDVVEPIPVPVVEEDRPAPVVEPPVFVEPVGCPISAADVRIQTISGISRVRTLSKMRCATGRFFVSAWITCKLVAMRGMIMPP